MAKTFGGSSKEERQKALDKWVSSMQAAIDNDLPYVVFGGIDAVNQGGYTLFGGSFKCDGELLRRVIQNGRNLTTQNLFNRKSNMN